MSVIRAAMILVPAVLLPASAEAVRSDWSSVGEAQLRLMALPPEGNQLRAGVEIALEPGWYTYWRNPGEAGIPPVFDFSRSSNVASVEVQYPAPQRYDDGTSVSVIYPDQVVFPVTVTPKDPALPVTLRLDADFGMCREICIPAKAQAEVDVPTVSAPDPLTETVLATVTPRLPGQPQPGRFDIERVNLDSPDEMTIDLRTPDGADADLFVDAPAGWFIRQPELVSRQGPSARYRLSLEGRPRGASVAGEVFRFVAVAGSQAIEEIVRLP
jgi:DsbC/DsbD-like thiol-disulfide interchange protein